MSKNKRLASFFTTSVAGISLTVINPMAISNSSAQPAPNPATGQITPDACGAIMEKNSIVPYKDWGSTPVDVQKLWDKSDCNHWVCVYMKNKYNVIAYKSWGSLPPNLQKIWDTPEVDCNHHV